MTGPGGAGSEPAGPAATPQLEARTRRLDLDAALLTVAGDDGFAFVRAGTGLAGSGVAVSIEAGAGGRGAASAVADVLGAIESDDAVGHPGCGPVAFGALPFAPGHRTTLRVPRVVVGRGDDGTRWLTTVAPADAADLHERWAEELHERLHRAAGRARVTATGDYRVASTRDPREWCAAVADARDALRRGDARKVVLARELIVTAEDDLDVGAILERLEDGYPGCHLFSVDGFVGASPELLVARVGDIVRSHPMAGTAPRSADLTTDARLAAGLLASAKDREEHRITIDAVHDALLPFCSYLDEEAEPSVVAVANVQHLATLVEGRLSAPAASVLELVEALHPTPAVCGSPRAAALALIARHEGGDRGRYAGPVGWVDAAGNGTWAVGIRSAEISGRTARLFAGVGVVADSDPDAELAETQAKFQAMLGAVVRP